MVGGGDIRYWLKFTSFWFVMTLCVMIYVRGGRTLHKCKKVTNTGNVEQAVDAVDAVDTVDTVDTVCSGCSGIVVYDGGDIVFGTKRSNQWMQWMQWNSGIWWWEHCLWYKKVKPVDAVDAVE